MERLPLNSVDLHTITLTNSLTKQEIRPFLEANHLRCYRVESQKLLHSAGDVCSFIEIVVSGMLAVENLNEDGEIFPVAVFGPQSVVGGNLIFSSKALYPYSVSCLKESVIVRIDTKIVLQLCTMSTPFLLQFLQIISENTAVLHERLAHVSQKGLRQRLTQYLVAESAKQQTQKIVLPLTKVRLAQLLGVSRTSLSREFTAMQKAGLLTYNRNIVKLSHFFEGCIF